ncbi:MAG: hypothetical protein JNN25_12880, partial [Candidatus Kapabacteria bacterium]|nr:hypothetical protein [Candidatus Kapabacteria bacterium]
EAPTKHVVKHTSLVSVVEFDRTLQNVDNDVILEYSPEEFTDLLTPIYEMFDEIHATDRALQQYRGKVPMPAIIVFLDDKGIYRIAQELEDVMKTRSLRYVGQREFLHLLNGIVSKLEQETPLPPSLHADPTTLPLAFDDEPIIKADDTIGELALGAAKRTPKASAPAETPMVGDAPASETSTTEPQATETIRVSILGEAVMEDSTSELAQAEHEAETHRDESAIHSEHALKSTAANTSTENQEQDLPQTFGTELLGLAAMMQELQTSETQPEIHDAEYVMIPPDEETPKTDGSLSEPPHSITDTTNTAEAEQTKSTLFSRWSSIFAPRTEE